MSNKKKIYIAGAGGMLGEAFYKIFSNDYNLKCTDIDVNESWLEYLDFTDRDSYINDVEEFNPFLPRSLSPKKMTFTSLVDDNDVLYHLAPSRQRIVENGPSSQHKNVP